MDNTNFDVDILNQNFLASKLNSNVELIQYEKEQLIGIMLAFRDGRIDSRLLKYLGFEKNDLKENLNIWHSFYKVKERRGQLSDQDLKKYTELKDLLSTKKIIKTIEELIVCGLNNCRVEESKDIFKNILKSVEAFSPSILMHGENQVYWDVDSYIHIALRHLKDYQLGTFRDKTPFPYRENDLKNLIEQVLGRVENELKAHLAKKSNKDFTRHGRMGVFFNGDHYSLRIDPSGKLIQFHMVSKKT